MELSEEMNIPEICAPSASDKKEVPMQETPNASELLTTKISTTESDATSVVGENDHHTDQDEDFDDSAVISQMFSDRCNDPVIIYKDGIGLFSISPMSKFVPLTGTVIKNDSYITLASSKKGVITLELHPSSTAQLVAPLFQTDTKFSPFGRPVKQLFSSPVSEPPKKKSVGRPRNVFHDSAKLPPQVQKNMPTAILLNRRDKHLLESHYTPFVKLVKLGANYQYLITGDETYKEQKSQLYVLTLSPSTDVKTKIHILSDLLTLCDSEYLSTQKEEAEREDAKVALLNFQT